MGAFISIDGVIQGPSDPDEDRSNGFDLGSWNVPASDRVVAEAMGRLMGGQFDLLLGRKSYELLRAHWTLAAKRGDETGQLFNRINKNCSRSRQ